MLTFIKFHSIKTFISSHSGVCLGIFGMFSTKILLSQNNRKLMFLSCLHIEAFTQNSLCRFMCVAERIRASSAHLVSFLICRSLLLLQAAQRRGAVAGPRHLTSWRLLHEVSSHPGVVLKSVTWTANTNIKKKSRDEGVILDINPKCFWGLRDEEERPV